MDPAALRRAGSNRSAVRPEPCHQRYASFRAPAGWAGSPCIRSCLHSYHSVPRSLAADCRSSRTPRVSATPARSTGDASKRSWNARSADSARIATNTQPSRCRWIGSPTRVRLLGPATHHRDRSVAIDPFATICPDSLNTHAILVHRTSLVGIQHEGSLVPARLIDRINLADAKPQAGPAWPSLCAGHAFEPGSPKRFGGLWPLDRHASPGFDHVRRRLSDDEAAFHLERVRDGEGVLPVNARQRYLWRHLARLMTRGYRNQ